MGEASPAGLAAPLPPLLPRALRLRGFLTLRNSLSPLAPPPFLSAAAAAACRLLRQSRHAATSRPHSRQPRAVYRPMSRMAWAAGAELFARAPSPPRPRGGAPPPTDKGRAEALGLRDAVVEGLQLPLLAAAPPPPPPPPPAEEPGEAAPLREGVGEAGAREAPLLGVGLGDGVVLGEAPLLGEGVGGATELGAGEGAPGVEGAAPVDTEGGLGGRLWFPPPPGLGIGMSVWGALPDRETLEVAEGDAPTVSEGVGEADKVLLEERSALPVLEGLAPRVKDAVGVAVLALLPLGEAGGGGEGTAGGGGVGVGGLPEQDRELLPVEEGEAPTVSEAVGEAEAVLLLEGPGGGEEALVGGVPVSELVEEGLAAELLDQDALGEVEADAPVERVGVGEVDMVGVAEGVVLGVEEAVPVPEDVGEPVGEELGVGGGVLLLESELLPLLEGVAPLVSEAVGEAEAVELGEVVVEGVKDPVPVHVLVGVPVGEGVSVVGGVAALDKEVLAVLLAEAPAEREAVDEADTVVLQERVVEGVKDPVPVPLTVGEPVGEELGVGGGVPLLESELLPLLEGVAPLVSEAVGEADSVELADMVVEGVIGLVPVPVPVGVGVGVCVGETEAGMLEDADAVGEGVVVAVGGAEFELVPVGV